ncbi:FKBP-type peptidyl-prolyl cis-trans isomerase [Plesiomonas shigelloides]|uniref:FKBP-type peptidyl-prolyl cis-trans isomerase n=1 Tax=Plesiomonas shigelloides TaxID=703 RepID=UPI001CE331F5|nr:FKBP-type peptidyl-prolyl cis-trans isomerase [Plesiomonas shigelloides]
MSKIILLIAVLVVVLFFIKNMSGNTKQAEAQRQQGATFLEQNKTKPGVITTASGLQYEVLQPGTGTVHPKATDTVSVHYHGTLIDGTVFDSSVQRGEPISFPLNRVIAGWTEGVPLMVEGEKVRFFIPSNLAYGNRAMGKIPAGSTLIFDVELLKINP